MMSKIKMLQQKLQNWHDNRFIFGSIQRMRRLRRPAMNNKISGFTLIELMIVVAIIGILASLAIPAYLDYAVRAQVGHGVNLAAGAKVAVAEYYQDRGDYPGNNATAGIADAANITGEYVESVRVSGEGLIQVEFGNEVNNKIFSAVLTFTPTDNGGSLSWACAGDATLVDKWLPPACR
jgi:type IV pilus assembly protein PilA